MYFVTSNTRNNGTGLKCAELFLIAGADPSVGNDGYHSPLMTAVSRNNLDMAKLLLQHVGDVNKTRCIGGETPLCFAVPDRNETMTTVLLENKADPNIASIDGQTPLLVAVHNNDISLTKLLLRQC